MGVRTCESRCLFSGSKGEVCCIEPLHSKPELKDHPITQFSLLAMASLTKVGVFRNFDSASRDSKDQNFESYGVNGCHSFIFSQDTGHWIEAVLESLDDFSLRTSE